MIPFSNGHYVTVWYFKEYHGTTILLNMVKIGRQATSWYCMTLKIIALYYDLILKVYHGIVDCHIQGTSKNTMVLKSWQAQ